MSSTLSGILPTAWVHRYEKDTFFFRQSTDFSCRLDRADLVIHRHNGNQNSFVSERISQSLQINKSVSTHGQIANLKTALF